MCNLSSQLCLGKLERLLQFFSVKDSLVGDIGKIGRHWDYWQIWVLDLPKLIYPQDMNSVIFFNYFCSNKIYYAIEPKYLIFLTV